MSSRSKAKILTALIFAVLFAISHHGWASRRRALGKQGFLASQAQYFDRFYTKPDHVVVHVVGSMLFAGAVMGAYELIALGINVIIKPKSDGDGT